MRYVLIAQNITLIFCSFIRIEQNKSYILSLFDSEKRHREKSTSFFQTKIERIDLR